MQYGQRTPVDGHRFHIRQRPAHPGTREGEGIQRRKDFDFTNIEVPQKFGADSITHGISRGEDDNVASFPFEDFRNRLAHALGPGNFFGLGSRDHFQMSFSSEKDLCRFNSFACSR